MSCGQPVAASTPADETRLTRLAAATPAPLADKMRAAHLEGERKTVTVLFADVVGSTALAEQMDAEDWTTIMNRAFERLSPAIYVYEGTIARLMGDALLAFFGAPVAHEDDPVRAIRAALDLLAAARKYAADVRRDRGIEFAVRVGMNTGLVVVGGVGSDLKYEYTAMGDAVNLAARMQTAADPDTVLISEHTYRLAARFFEFEDRGMIAIKGKAEPVQAYRVIGERRGVVQARGIEGLTSPLIGRDSEMRILRGAVSELRQGRGQIVSVMGDAGLGKSRLVAELRQWLIADGVSLIANGLSPFGQTPYAFGWLEGRSLSYETTTPYAPFADLLHQALELRSDATAPKQYDTIKARVAKVAPGHAADIAPFLAMLLQIPPTGEDVERVQYLEPPQVRQRVFQAVIDFIEGLAAQRPLVLVFEDLHWADPTSLDLLEQVAPLAERATLMILALFRSQPHEPSWRFHESAARDYAHRYTSIMLQPLDDESSRELVANLLEIEDLPETVRRLILRKAEGNPFFVEEVIRSLLDARLVVRDNSHWRATREIENIAVPDTLIGVITARLDRLDDESKRVAQAASVIGREFQSNVLASVYETPPTLDGALDRLQQRELIREKSRLPQRAYLFKHVLTQEAAYASVLLSRRRELHRRVATCLERIAPDRVGDIARHFLEAQEMARALPYLVKAGDRVARAYATPEAIGFYTRALEILQTVEDLNLARRAYEGLGSALMLVNDIQRAVENYHTMLHYAEARGDAPMRVSALNKLSSAAMWLGQFELIERHLTESEHLARASEDRVGMAELYTVRCNVCLSTADFGGAVKYLGESVQIGRELNLKEQLAFGLTHMANTQLFLTRFDEMWETAQEGLQLARELGDRQHESELLACPIPFYHLRNGNLDAARQAAEEGVSLAARIGSAYSESVGSWVLGNLAQMRGEHEGAIASYRRAADAGRASGYLMFEVIPLGALGSAYLEVSETFLEQAAGYHVQALKLMEHPTGAPAGGTAWADIGFCVLAKGDLDRAHEFFQKGLTVPTTQGLLSRPRHLIGLASVALAHNQIDDAAKFANEARAFVEERAMKHLLPLVAFTDARVSAARGEPERALEFFTRTEVLALEMQMRPLVWQAQVEAAKALSALGREVEAEAKRREARALIDEIAGLFTDAQLRAMFVESAAKKSGGM